MNDKTKLLQGKHLKEIRRILGLSQKAFGSWLSALDINSRGDVPYKEATIAAWENGRRNIPEAVKKCISENVTVNGQNIQYSYLNGNSKYMTSFAEKIGDSIHMSYEIIENSLPSYFEIPKDKQKAFNKVMHEILVIYEISENEIPDFQHFSKYMYQEFKDNVNSYMGYER